MKRPESSRTDWGAELMKLVRAVVAMRLCVWILLSLSVLIGGCGSPQGTLAGAAVVTGMGSGMVGQEIHQIYYLGVFDPREQTPSAIFRLTVRGQASAINTTRFACGWVPAVVADSLNTDLSFQNGRIVVPSATEREALGGIETGRRLVLFGPEGFREAPRDHRLVLVMASSPEKSSTAAQDARWDRPDSGRSAGRPSRPGRRRQAQEHSRGAAATRCAA